MDDGEELLEAEAIGEEGLARGISTVQQLLLAAVSSDHGVLLRQEIMNSHVKDIQFSWVWRVKDLLAHLILR